MSTATLEPPPGSCRVVCNALRMESYIGETCVDQKEFLQRIDEFWAQRGSDEVMNFQELVAALAATGTEITIEFTIGDRVIARGVI
jgi:hypothetical protein